MNIWDREDMINFLFWNLRGKPLKEHVTTLCREHEVDILILAESNIPQAELLDMLNKNEVSKFEAPHDLSKKLRFYVKFPAEYFKSVRDERNIAIRKLELPNVWDILIVAVHLPSKLYLDSENQTLMCPRYADLIRKAESKVGHCRTLVVGDFNMNPFENGVVNSEGFHALMDRRLTIKKSRKVWGVKRQFFYNPMWGKMSDSSEGPPGTYYYRKSVPLCYIWNTFDQVLLRPELLDFFSNDHLKVIDNISGTPLLSKTGIPDKKSFSDHLPLFFKLQIEKEA
ncbi:endonuclease/exonuclease/phosphatase family protein [Desulfobacterales bacterium HSG2]|nr:endonuclease/exonuclease/phosphatase family protein [Desulfobacterales bacterium HSG2]